MFRFILFLIILSNTALSNENFGKWIVVDQFKVNNKLQSYITIDCYDCDNCIAFGNTYPDNEPFNRYTTNGGKTWHTSLFDEVTYVIIDGQARFYRPSKVYNVSYTSPNLCIALADSGYYWRSVDHLQTWTKHKIQLDRRENMWTRFLVKFCDTLNGVILSPFEVFNTYDGGLNWNSLNIAMLDEEYQVSNRIDVVIKSKMDIICLAYNQAKQEFLIKTTDGGESWNFLYDFPSRIMCISFLGEKIGYAGGIGYNEVAQKHTSLILKTTDGGYSWARQLDTAYFPYQRIDKIDIFDEINAVAYTQYYPNLWRTTNGGGFWFRDTSVHLNQFNTFVTDLRALSHNCVYAVTESQNKIFKYSDDPVSVADQQHDASDKPLIYPNPTTGDATLKVSNDYFGEIELEIFNIYGERNNSFVLQKYEEIMEFSFNMSNKTQGLYYYRVKAGGVLLNSGQFIVIK